MVVPSWGYLRGPLARGQDPPSFAETVILPCERLMGSRLLAGNPTLFYPLACLYGYLMNIIYLSSTPERSDIRQIVRTMDTEHPG